MRKYLLFLCFLIFGNYPYAQNNDVKVGLVLSGGGAKGLAHIGVLKVLEEQGVKIDYIAGTSMGAIVGGLYASGYTASEIESVFKELNADALIKDYIPRISKSFYEKQNDEIYALTLPFENFRIGLPKALSKGLYNYNLLSRLLAHVRHERDFSKLKIPFLCIATDMETGEAVTLKEGNLPQSIFASGAFPSLYAPVEIDGRIFIDGGIVNNYPIAELRAMGADIVIGVDVQDGLKDRDAIVGATELMLQISNFFTYDNMPPKIKDTDIYIKPDIEKYSVVSFNVGDEIIKKGEEAAKKVLDKIRKLSVDYDVMKNHFEPKYTDSLRIKNINIDGITNYTRRYVHGKLGFQPYSSITYQDLSKGIEKLNATQNFSEISYQFDEDEDGDCFTLTLKEDPVRRFLKFGIHYDELYKSAALINITQKKLFLKSDVFSLDLGIGDNLRYNFNYYVDNGFYWSVGFNSKYNQFTRTVPIPRFSTDQNTQGNLEINYDEVVNKLYFQTFFAQKLLIGIGIEHKYLDVRSKTYNNKVYNFDKTHYLSTFGNLTFDTYDNKYFPRKGFVFKGEYKSYFHSKEFDEKFDSFSIVKGELGFAQSIYKNLTVDVRSKIGFTIGSEPNTFFNFFLGGFGFSETDNILQFYGHDFLNLFGNSFVSGRVQLDYEIFQKHHVNFAANYANVDKDLFESVDWISKPMFNGYAIGYGFHTLIGPIEIKHSWSPDTRKHFTWFGVGFWF